MRSLKWAGESEMDSDPGEPMEIGFPMCKNQKNVDFEVFFLGRGPNCASAAFRAKTGNKGGNPRQILKGRPLSFKIRCRNLGGWRAPFPIFVRKKGAITSRVRFRKKTLISTFFLPSYTSQIQFPVSAISRNPHLLQVGHFRLRYRWRRAPTSAFLATEFRRRRR